MRLLLIPFILHLSINLYSQSVVSLPDLPHPTDRAFSFVLHDKLIYGTGVNEDFEMNNEVWMFDLKKHIWIQLNNFPTVPIRNCISMVIRDTAYVGFGRDNNNGYGWFKYDELNDVWIEKNSQCNVGQFSATFEYEGKGYAVCGSGKNGETNETWVYDPEKDSWTQKADFPGSPRDFPFACVLNNKAYVGMGDGFLSPPFYADAYEYDFDSDSWLEIFPIPLSSTSAAAAGACFFSRPLDKNRFAIMALDGIITNDLNDYNTIYVYDQNDNAWTLYENANPVGSRGVPVVGHYNLKSYYGGGNDFISGVKKDFWEYDFSSVISKINEQDNFSKLINLNINGVCYPIKFPNSFPSTDKLACDLISLDGKIVKSVDLNSDWVTINLNANEKLYSYALRKNNRLVKSGKLLIKN